jgi:hypothetical protein
MKELKRGDMMEVFGEVDHFIVAVGSKLRSETKELIMLNGLSGVLGTKYPTLPAAMGKWIAETCGDGGAFYLRCAGKVGIIQNMDLPRNGVNLSYIGAGVLMLSQLARLHSEKKYALEWPGHTEPEWLLKNMFDKLPANVEVWKP